MLRSGNKLKQKLRLRRNYEQRLKKKLVCMRRLLNNLRLRLRLKLS